MAKLTMVQALNLALHQEMEKDADVVVLGEDVGVDGGVFRVTDGLIERFGEERVLDTPLSENGIVLEAVLGEDTLEIAAPMIAYDPTSEWAHAE